MLSAAGFPIVLYGPVHLPGIAPHNITLYAVLRLSHSVLALLLFVTSTVHMCAVLFHTFVLRDKILDRMALWPTRHPRPQRHP
jgi:cytochrome b561